ncbi:MAG: hypothetical protein ACAH59_02835 [Pseudobdellovibrionaceae bacterium]
MRPQFIFGTLVVGIFFFSHALMGKKDNYTSQLSVRQQVDSEIDNLKKNLSQSHPLLEKWKFLAKSESQIETLRKKSPLQIDKDEFYMDQLALSLKRIPRDKDFKTENCESYQTSILAQFDPQSEKQSEPISQTLGILEILCK